MPEIAEVARVVHYLRKHLVNRTIKSCQAFEDDIVYGKVGCSASAFQKSVQGKTVTGAGQQGKYFYVTFDSPPHSVMHLGMTGWIKVSAEETGYYRKAKDAPQAEEWPPKYMKFLLKCDAEEVNGEQRDPVEIAFIDARRLARIRLVDCKASGIRQETPLKENGPDPVIDKAKCTVEWLTALLNKKKVPVKALLLDQGNISGIGNWVADEVLYQARIHPEQYSNTFNDEQIKRLHDAIDYVCSTACSELGDSTKFPEDWLMKYRWDKGKKDGNVLPNGAKIVHLKVGGRTSAVVPSVQKKTGAVAGDVSVADLEDDDANGNEEKPATKSRKRKGEQQDDDEGDEARPVKLEKKSKASQSKATASVKEEVVEKSTENTSRTLKAEGAGETAGSKSRGRPKGKKSTDPKAETPVNLGTRRSTRSRG